MEDGEVELIRVLQDSEMAQDIYLNPPIDEPTGRA
jgi:hypothetical protein